MTGALSLGLAVALGGALLLAVGSELQSRAVFEAGGSWPVFLRSARWWGGLLTLGTAVASNFVALALAPVSLVQSMSVIALAVSAAFAHLSGRARVGGFGAAAIGLCAVGIIGFVTVMRGSLSDRAAEDPFADLAAVTAILGGVTALGIVAWIAGRQPRKQAQPKTRGQAHVTQSQPGSPQPGSPAHRLPLLAGLFVAAVIFGSVTAVFKTLVTIAQRDGVAALATAPGALLGVAAVVAGGIVANVLLQRSHHRFPAPVVVASITIVDPLTAAIIGIRVLGEAQLTAPAALALLAFGAVACAGVLGLTRVRRAQDPAVSPTPTALT